MLTAGLHVLALVIVAIVGAALNEGLLFLMFGGFLGVTQLVVHGAGHDHRGHAAQAGYREGHADRHVRHVSLSTPCAPG